MQAGEQENSCDFIGYWLCTFALVKKGRGEKAKFQTQNIENFHTEMLCNLSALPMGLYKASTPLHQQL